jgi:hypothetical protein
MFRFFYLLLISYLVYKGIMFLIRLFASFNKKNVSSPVSPKSKFKDVEEAHYTEIKNDKDKDSH